MPKKSRREIALEQETQRLEMEKLVKEKVKEINSNLEENIEDVSGYEETIIAIALLEQSTDENPIYISPLGTSPRLLATSGETSIRKLQSVVSYLGFVDDECKSGYLQEGVLNWNGLKETYYVMSCYDNPKKHLIETHKKCAFDEGDAYFILMDVRDFLVEECVQFLKSTREDYGFPHKVGEKSKQLFIELLWNWSPGQIFNFIWRSAKEAAALMMREKLSKEHTSNVIIGGVERMARKAMQDNWTIELFNRHKNDRQSWMSYVYFTLMYELKGAGIEYTMQDLVAHSRINLEIDIDTPPSTWLLTGAPEDVVEKYRKMNLQTTPAVNTQTEFPPFSPEIFNPLQIE